MNICSNGKYQKGQALPLGLALLMAGVLFGIVLFNTGQLASEKSRLANTADAAAYSGLIWQARALNFQAYTNRAMVANQVSIGQMVSLASWMQNARHLTRNIDRLATVVSIVTFGAASGFKAATVQATQIIDSADAMVMNAVKAAIPVIDSVNGVLSPSQEAIYLATFAATPELVKGVVKENDPRYNVESSYAVMGLGRNAAGWGQFSEQYDADKRYENHPKLVRKADIINRSKDDFTKYREFGLSDMLFGLVPDKVGVPPLMIFSVKKEGVTNLVMEDRGAAIGSFESGNEGNASKWEWKGKDTFSVHIKRWGCSWRRGCGWRHSEIPLGWGSRYINGDFECNEGIFGTDCKRYLKKNRRAERLADWENEEIDLAMEYQGLRAYYDLKDLSEENRDPRLTLRIEVQLPEDNVETSSKIKGLGSRAEPAESRNGMGKGMFWAGDEMAASSMASIASAEIYFHPPDDYRPDRRRGKVQVGNLFSPYWEVRLAETPLEERYLAWGLRDDKLLTEGANGVSEGVALFVKDREEELQRLQQTQQELLARRDGAVDENERNRLQQQISGIESRISQLESLSGEKYTSGVASELEQGLRQGASAVGRAGAGRYEQQLQEYAQDFGGLGNDFAAKFERQFIDQMPGVDQITEQVKDNLLGALGG